MKRQQKNGLLMELHIEDFSSIYSQAFLRFDADVILRYAGQIHWLNVHLLCLRMEAVFEWRRISLIHGIRYVQALTEAFGQYPVACSYLLFQSRGARNWTEFEEFLSRDWSSFCRFYWSIDAVSCESSTCSRAGDEIEVTVNKTSRFFPSVCSPVVRQ